jgi:hypothetical protein
MKLAVADRFTREFGPPSREVVKVKSWNVTHNVGAVLQVDQPARENAAYVWLPYPGEGQPVPEIALEYPGEAGRHSGTYPAAGLKRGEPALKLTICSAEELEGVVSYIRAMASNANLPEIRGRTESERSPVRVTPGEPLSSDLATFIDPTSMPRVEPTKPRREAISRSVQREVWQRDGGRCVECSTREKLCFDHIVPFSRGGSNSVRNIQLLCESCNLSKGNRI